MEWPFCFGGHRGGFREGLLMAGRKQFEPVAALDAAVRVFWERGFRAASMTDLVAGTALNRASLYGTFGDKEHLFLLCLQRYVDTVGAPGGMAVAADWSDPGAAAGSGFDAILNRFDDPAQPAGCLLAQTAAESGGLPASIQAAVAAVLEERITCICRSLTESRDQTASDGDLKGVAAYIVAVAQALAVMHRAGTPIGTLRQIAAHAVKTLDAVLPPAPVLA